MSAPQASKFVSLMLGLTLAQRAEFLESLPTSVAKRVRYSWELWARPDQLWRPGPEIYTIYLAGRRYGKALALDTPIATPSGWATMGELEVGDLVIDDCGEPCRVTFATDVQYDRTCFELRFDSGARVVADAEHRWQTRDRHGVEAIRTTLELVDTIGDQHSIAAVPPSSYVRRWSRSALVFRHRVVEIIAAASVPVRCITVDSPSRLFVCGREMVPTHNTRAGAEAVRYVAAHPELCSGVIGIAGRTANDVNQTMLHGESGLFTCYHPRDRPRHWKSDRIIEWKNGVIARLLSGQEPESFRGPGYGFLWADELPHWTHLAESWSNAVYALSLGELVRSVITTTPIGVETLERLVWEFDKKTDAPIVADESDPFERVLQGFRVHPAARVITGATYDNAANLAPNYLAQIIAENESTATADQEIRGRILRDVPTAIFRRQWLRYQEQLPDDVDQVIVMIDPSGSVDPQRARSSEVGMVVLAQSVTGMIYILQDASGRMTPEQWGARAWALADRWGADAIVAEANFGREMVPATLRAARPRANTNAIVKTVDAHRDKATRASLTVPLFQSGRVVFCGDPHGFVHLVRQMCSWDPTKPKGAQPSPDRLDATVWGVLYFANGGDDRRRIRALGDKETWRKIAEELQRRSG